MDSFKATEGTPLPIGATVYPNGVNFCVFSRNATRIVLNLYNNQEDTEPCFRLELSEKENRTGDLWHVFVEGAHAGTLYLYQVDGPFDITKGHRFNFNKFLLDPYAKALTPVSVFEHYKQDDNSGVCSPHFPKCVVIDDDAFDWQGDRPLGIKLKDSVIYETHLRGYTVSPSSPVSSEKKGTYKGFIEIIPYLKKIGITAVEFLPIHEFDENEGFATNPRTKQKLKNFWGYSTISFFAPKANYASDLTPGACVTEFKEMVRELHKNGIEVILDVVFNHTAEGNEHGATLSFRGFDNSIFYMLTTNKEYYYNYSGCGNTVNCNHPVMRDYIVECLRYWVLQMHVDGFRFDLGSILSRSQIGELLKDPPLLHRISEDPVLARTKIIAEPWDAGGAYQVGWFPGGRWAEWNDRYRDDMRRFWRGDKGMLGLGASRACGSADIYAASGRKPYHSINYITCHDGFTMNDLVSYNVKHNADNGEGNIDGSDNNNSYNCGCEGYTDDKKIERTRRRLIRNFLLTLLISQGTPMVLAGDEFRRTQHGNNNAYCQDNSISWVDWELAEENADLVEFFARAVRLRKEMGVFNRADFFEGGLTNSNKPDIRWYAPDGTVPDWKKLDHCVGCVLPYLTIKNAMPEERLIFVVSNTDFHDVLVQLPPANGKNWHRVADTSIDSADAILVPGSEELLASQKRYVVPAGSQVILMAR